MKRVTTTAMAGGIFLALGAWGAASAATPVPSIAAVKSDPESFAAVTRRSSGHVSFLGASVQSPLPESVPALTPEARARGFISSYRSLFVADGLPLDLVTARVDAADATGIGRVRLQQLLAGVPVRGAVADVLLTDNVITATSLALASPAFVPSGVPTVSATDAASTALAAVAAKYGPVNVQLSEPQLEFFNPALADNDAAVPVLTWYFEAVGDTLREQVWIDATTGALNRIQSRLTEARNRRVFDANGGANIPATPTRTENQGATGITDVDRAHDYAGDFYNYFLAEHGRDSFNGNGATMDAVVRYCPAGVTCPYRNAFWNGARVTFGAGFAVDDVVAHELTHAVIDYTAILFYQDESGALNESYADIFGETVDLGNGRGGDAANQRWAVGEDLPGVNGGIRNMSTPGTYTDPARVKDPNYYCLAGDNGGVHTNSGVSNHAYALIADGGTYNGYTISGLGLTKAAKIHYRALTVYLKEFSTYLDNFNAVIQSCNDLIGTSGITYADCAHVKHAVLSVEMSTKPCTTATPPAAPPAAPAPLASNGAQCPTGQAPLFVFQDDFENTSSGKWTTAALSGANHWTGGVGVPAIHFSGNAAGGVYSLHATPASAAGHSYVILASPVAVPAGATLQFDSKYEFEPGIDGGVVEYSTNNGSTWTDAAPLFRSGRGYDAGLANGLGNPLGGRTAYSGSAPQYATTRVDMNSLSGSNVLLRFRTGTDSTVAAPGWWIDNVSIFSCVSQVAGATVTPMTGLQVSETQTSATFTIALTSAPAANVTIGLSSSDATEAAVSPVAVTFTSTNWSTPQTVTVTGVDDAIDDGNVAFSIITAPAVSSDPVYNTFNAADVSGTTIDNDTAGISFTRTTGLNTSETGKTALTEVRLNSAPTATVTLAFVSSDITEGTVSPASLSFSAADWNTAKTVTITGINDDAVDGDVAYTVATSVTSGDTNYSGITVPPIAVVNTDDDSPAINVSPNGGLVTAEAGSTATFLIRLATQPSANVVIGFTSSDTTEGTVSPASVTFTAANWAQGAVITVTGVDDNIADGNVAYTIVTAPAVSGDLNYSGLNPTDVTVTNQDNESANIVINTPERLVTTEAGGTATFTVALTTEPTADVVIGLSSSRTTEGTVLPASLTFNAANWNQPATVTVTGVDDTLADGDQTYSVVFASSVSADMNYNGRRPAAVLVDNQDNETVSSAQPSRSSPRIVVGAASKLRTTEDGGSATFTVKLSRTPLANVTIRVSTSNTNEGRASVRQLVFTPENGEQPQSVTVVGRDDSDTDGDASYNVILGSPVSDDPDFNGLDKIEIQIVNADNDSASAAAAIDPLVLVGFLLLMVLYRYRYGR